MNASEVIFVGFMKNLGICVLSIASIASPSMAAHIKPQRLDTLTNSLSVEKYMDAEMLDAFGTHTYRTDLNVMIPVYSNGSCNNVNGKASLNYVVEDKDLHITLSVPGVGEVASFTDLGLDGMIDGTKDKIRVLPGYLIPPKNSNDVYGEANKAYQVVIDAINASLAK